MKIAFFDTKPYFRDSFSPLAKKYGHEITYFNERLTTETAKLAAGHDATCSFVNDEVPAEAIRTLKEVGVKVILLRCAGFDSVDLDVAKECGLPVLRVPSYSPESVAEHGMALLLGINRKLHLSYNRSVEFNFDIDGLTGICLYGRTAGVIGTGKIGKAMVNLLKAIGMKVICYDAYPDKSSGFDYVDLDTLYKESDVISLHCPYTPETYHMINAESLAKMKDGVLIINIGRGVLIDSNALVDAVESGKVGGAGLDVCDAVEHDYFFEDRRTLEPKDPTLKRLLSNDKILLTGHLAFLTDVALNSIAEVTLQNLTAFAEGKELVNRVV